MAGGHRLRLGGRHARTMLAALAVRAGQVVPAELLIDAMWGGEAPRTAPHALHVQGSALRKLVPGDLPGARPAPPLARPPAIGAAGTAGCGD